MQSKLQLDKQESCYQKSSVVNQVFFLAPDRHGRSLARSSSDLSEYYYLPKYQALKATPKIIQIVEKIVFDNGDLPMLNQEIQTTTESKPFLFVYIAMYSLIFIRLFCFMLHISMYVLPYF